MKKTAGLLSLLLLNACSSGNEPNADRVLTSNDFEAVAGWGSDPALLEQGRAHSGQYAIQVNKDREFSLTYQIPLSVASPDNRIKTLHVEAWALLVNDRASGDLVVQVFDPAQNNRTVFYDAIKLAEAVKTYNNWVRISKDIAVPDTVTAAQQLKVYLWRSSATEPVLLDDLKITATTAK